MPDARQQPKARVVLDSNAVISGLAFRGGKPREILDLLRAGEIQAWLSPFMLEEIARSLRHDFDWDEQMIKDALDALQAVATVMDPRPETTIVKQDPADNRVLDCAVEGSVQYVVTGDRRHLLPLKEFRGIRILNPDEFLSFLRQGR